MGKNWDTRIDETIVLLRGYNTGLNATYSEAVGEYLAQQNVGIALKTTSKKMSQGAPLFGDTAALKAFRARRRAIILIRSEILGIAPAVAKTQTAAILDVSLDNQLNQVLGQAANQILIEVQNEWGSFCNQTATFLQNNELIIRKDSTGGVRPAVFGHDYAVNRFRLYPTSALGVMPRSCIHTMVQANHIPVTRWDAVQNNLGNLTGVQANSNHLVVTTQLTGCSYVYQINGNHMQIAHIWPHGAVDAQVMGTTLAANAGFAASNGGAVQVFRAQPANSATGYCHVATWTYPVAAYNGAWELHMQQVPQGGGTITYLRVV